MSARLHVLLGEGGVGKTTLAAAYALALAGGGGRVALLSIDPARRLQTALGLPLADAEPTRVGGIAPPGELHAAVLAPEATLRRWATEGLADRTARERVLASPLFVALADRLATTTDVIAAVHVAEWLDRDPSLTDFVVDTAPGRNGVDFLRRPGALAGLFHWRLAVWLRRLGSAPDGEAGGRERAGGLGARILRGLAHLAGGEMLLDLARLFAAMEHPLALVLTRLESAQAWLHRPTTEILLVTAVREDSAAVARALREAVVATGLAPAAVVVNRALPGALRGELAGLDESALDRATAEIVRYARAYADIQARVLAAVAPLAPAVVELRALSGLDTDRRLGLLASLGRDLRDRLRSGA